jgi:CDP-glycerol glycerophosphotransferase (TagB/SpsB family)
MVTGFPRTDPLINNSFNGEEIIKELGVLPNKKNILYAPSWGNPAAGENEEKSLFPFESDERILEDIDKFCIENNCNFIIRMHPNWENEEKEYARKIIDDVKKIKSIFYLPFKKYPVTEPILYVSDILITDYSSIAEDFILLDRPIIFMDTNLPKEKFVFTLGERAGYIVKNKKEFFGVLQNSLDSTEQFREEFKEKRQKHIEKLYKYADGKASQRCAEEIMRLLN